MAFSPVEASKVITDKYYRYLKTSFNIGDPYSKELQSLFDDNNALAKGPYLDVTDTFKSGKSINELIDEGLLPKKFSKLNFNLTRSLYLHQEQALRKIAQENKNIVVSTGTGSGKTESFLYPLLRELVIEDENGTLTPGVRALLVYPMNALANDQVERLREILVDYPEITFGVYTGQTEKHREKALAVYKSLNDNATPLKNELISREEMIDNPPHIFITNYAMLEYLMVRPTENEFFEGEYANNWKFIVFDEAHVYNGSTGIEVSMLFRRLKAKLQTDDIRYILTSATLGEKEDDDKVAEFAKGLCSAPFYDTDIIRAQRVAIKPNKDEIKHLDVSFYEKMSEALSNGTSNSKIIDDFNLDNSKSLEENLYDIVKADDNYWQIRELLKSPNTVKKIANKLKWTQEQVSAFVDVASICQKNGVKLFDARYHMFLRATDSAFVTLSPDNRIMLERQKYRVNEDDLTKYKVFEVATCTYCNAVYLIGKVVNNRLEQYSSTDDLESKEIFLLADKINDTDEDHTLEKEGIKAEKFKICPYCGYLHKATKPSGCGHNPEDEVTVFKLKLTDKHLLTKCPKCENVNNIGILRQLYTGQEASTSVIGTALYEQLPSYEIEKVDDNVETDDEFDDLDDFDDDSNENKVITKPLAKQFIAFSDSRQAAAYYASFLKTTYSNILYKRLIIEALKKIHDPLGCGGTEFIDRVQAEFERHKIVGDANDGSEYNQRKEATKAILKELVDNNAKTSLFAYGLLTMGIDPKCGYSKKDLSKSEFKDLCSNLILSMLSDAAINCDENLVDTDIEMFTHGVQYNYTLSDSTEKYNKSFIPTKSGLSNKRVDYLRRVLEKKAQKNPSLTVPDNDEAAAILESIWTKIYIPRNIVGLNKNNGYRVNLDSVILGEDKQWYICDKCHQLTCHNVENVCPSYKCSGTLRPINCDEEFKNNHYYRLYNDLDIRDLSVVEHTAQLDRATAYDYQNQFKQKKIDVLSCSTTFEMGVDVGSLETVFMRNMPPSPSNYAQRAGRAGRSKQSAAFALTFCNKASHDFSYFKDPVSMIKGKINPPKYTVDNERIGIRHLYASTFGFFWRKNPQYFKDVKTFVDEDIDGKSGYAEFCKYIKSQPEDLKQFLLNFLPESLAKKYKVENFGWIDGLIGERGQLTLAVDAYNEEIKLLNEQKELLNKENKSNGAIVYRINAYTEESILTFLSRKNVLPKYGFPVDTVEMTVNGGKSGLQLQRDLSMAISEYAPGSQIVANNQLITSRYINKIPRIGWKMYSYVKCPNCNTLNMKLYIDDEHKIEKCSQCGYEFGETRDTKTETFLIPELGFVAESNVKKPGLRKPKKTYSGEISYVGFRNDIEQKEYRIWNSRVNIRNSHNDEMAIVNRNNFYVCETCGYTEINDKAFSKTISKKHNSQTGYHCPNEILKKYSLGYTFKTDVVIIDFPDYRIENYNQGLSILYALLRGICLYLNIEEDDISGCLQMLNDSYSIIIFDNTPGGAGHSRRLDNEDNLKGVFEKALSVVENCTCGGEDGDSSCYFCLRNYRNQKHHDDLKRRDAIEFFNKLKS